MSDKYISVKVLEEIMRRHKPEYGQDKSKERYAYIEWLGILNAIRRECQPIEAVPVRGAFTIDEAAEMLSNLFGDECACNFNNIDEWLPQRCKYCAEGECPDPPDKHGCWKQFLIHGYNRSGAIR